MLSNGTFLPKMKTATESLIFVVLTWSLAHFSRGDDHFLGNVIVVMGKWDFFDFRFEGHTKVSSRSLLFHSRIAQMFTLFDSDQISSLFWVLPYL